MFHSSQLEKLPFRGTEIFWETGSVFVSGYLAVFLSDDIGQHQLCLTPSHFVCSLSEGICAASSVSLFPSPLRTEETERDGYEISQAGLFDRRKDKAPPQSLEASTGV